MRVVVAAGRSVVSQPETRLEGGQVLTYQITASRDKYCNPLCDISIVQANWRTCPIQTLLSPLEIQISDDPFGKFSNFEKVMR